MTKFLNISTDNTLGGSSPSDETVSSQKAIKEYVDNNTAPAGSYVTTNTAQTITEAKTFTKAVHFTGTGDTNAVFLTENTRFDIEGTTRTILGMGNAQFYINHSAYALLLRGKNARPSYNSATSYLALLSDVPTVNNPTITFTQGGTTKGTITLNQSGDQTIEFDAGGSGGGAVDSVNGQTGTVVLDAEDVGALPDTTVIPTVDQTYSSTSSNAQSGTAVASAVSGKQSTITGGATTITSNDLTSNRALVSNASGKVAVSSVTSTELGYVSGVTSAIQTQLNGKVSGNTSITGATKCKITYDSKGLVTAGANLSATDIPSLSLSKITDVTATASELNVLDGITATTTELNYVDGVTSSIQTQLNNKVASNTAITGATKCKITYDSKGLVTAGADLTSSDVTTALGFTPYDSSNPNGYTSNVGTVTSVNNVSPVNGNVTLGKCTTPATTTSTASEDSPVYLVENYYDSTSGEWYRIWSDGWIEQGLEATSGTTVTTYTFLKPFSNSNYTLVFGAATLNQYWSSKSTTGFKFNSNAANARSWYACGY